MKVHNIVQDAYDQMAPLPAGNWVAFSEEERRVLAYGEDLDAVLANAARHGHPHPFITRVPDPDHMLFF